MQNDIYSRLKSGTDIRGTALAGVPEDPVTLTDDVIENISCGFALWLSENIKPTAERFTVAVGHDSRLSAEHIKELFISQLLKCGIDVKDCGLSSTPAMFMTTVDFDCDAAVEITASHHPFNKNGFKFFTKKGGLEGTDIEEILANARYEQKPQRPEGDREGRAEKTAYMNVYAEHIREKICREVNADDYLRPLRGLKVIVDAGNGAGGFFAGRVLQPLGADISGSLFLEPDGSFPNHIPNPENKAAMAAVSKAVLDGQADFGIVFDTDVDRAACVLEDGREINRNAFIALASCIALEGNEGGTVVTDSVTSSGLKEFIETELGGKHHRFKRGYKNVINECKRLNSEECVNSPLAMETSGHAAMRENYFLDDGAYLITKLLIKGAVLAKEGKKLSSLIEKLKEPLEAGEYRIKIKAEDFTSVGNKVLSELSEAVSKDERYTLAKDSFEGVRASKSEAEGWFLLRLSVHDPVLPLNVEADREGGVKDIVEDLKDFLSGCDELDLSALYEKL